MWEQTIHGALSLHQPGHRGPDAEENENLYATNPDRRPARVVEATIDGIGTLRMPAVAGDMPPEDLTGAQLPPIDTYR